MSMNLHRESSIWEEKMKRLLTIKEVCELLGISRSTLFNRMKGVYRLGGVVKEYKSNNEFPKGLLVGGRIKFRASDIESYAERCAA